MKKPILPVLALLAPYLMIAAFLCVIHFTPELLQIVSPLLVYFLILMLGPVLGLTELLVGLCSKALSPARLAKWDLIVKLAHIPFYCIIFLLAFLAMPLFAPFFFLLDCAVLLVGPGFGIAAILRACRDGQLSIGAALLFGITHLIFVVDVLSAFLLWRRLRKN